MSFIGQDLLLYTCCLIIVCDIIDCANYQIPLSFFLTMNGLLNWLSDSITTVYATHIPLLYISMESPFL